MVVSVDPPRPDEIGTAGRMYARGTVLSPTMKVRGHCLRDVMERDGYFWWVYFCVFPLSCSRVKLVLL